MSPRRPPSLGRNARLDAEARVRIANADVLMRNLRTSWGTDVPVVRYALDELALHVARLRTLVAGMTPPDVAAELRVEAKLPTAPPPLPALERPITRLSRVEAYLHTHTGEKINLHALAGAVGLQSTSVANYLTRLLRTDLNLKRLGGGDYIYATDPVPMFTVDEEVMPSASERGTILVAEGSAEEAQTVDPSFDLPDPKEPPEDDEPPEEELPLVPDAPAREDWADVPEQPAAAAASSVVYIGPRKTVEQIKAEQGTHVHQWDRAGDPDTTTCLSCGQAMEFNRDINDWVVVAPGRLEAARELERHPRCSDCGEDKPFVYPEDGRCEDCRKRALQEAWQAQRSDIISDALRPASS